MCIYLCITGDYVFEKYFGVALHVSCGHRLVATHVCLTARNGLGKSDVTLVEKACPVGQKVLG